MVNDLNRPLDKLFFIMHDCLSTFYFDHYFCLMDIDKLCEAEKIDDT